LSLAPSEEQEALRGVVRQFLHDKSPEAAVRTQMATERGYDQQVWGQMARELGLQALIIPEELGGQGFGYAELCIALEEMGRALLCAPFFSTAVLAASTLMASGDLPAQRAVLPRIAAGEIIATLALTEPGGRWDGDGIEATASQGDEGWRITGVKSYVLDGHVADIVVVAARTARGVSLFTVCADAPGLTRTLMPTMDQTRKQARLDFDDVPGELIGAEGDGWPVLTTVLDLAAVGLAAEQLGGAQAVLEMAVGYAGQRMQFGQPIGAFQAVKHKCADMLVEVESARAAVAAAVRCAAERSDELPAMASLAKAFCSDAYSHAAAENIQVHGGIGFTWEHPAHLYFRRAKSSEVLLGDPAYHRELLAQRIGI